MAARKNLLKAQAFTTQRLVSALVDRDPDNPSPSLRRLSTATFVGVLIAALVTAGFGVVGFLMKPSTQAWQQDGAIVIDAAAGSVFVYVAHPDDPDPSRRTQLHPVPNITSARLITGGKEIHTTRTSSLTGTARGYAMGIAAAPNQLPDAKDVKTFPLRVCSIPADDDPATKMPRTRVTTLEIGMAPATSGRNDTVAAIDSAGTQYLVMNGHRYPLPKTSGGKSPLVEGAYMLDTRVDSWIESIPVDAPLEALEIPGYGNPAQRGEGNVGRLVSTGDNRYPDQLTYWVLLSDGYARIGYLDMKLLVLKHGREPVNVPDAEVTAATTRTSLHSPLPMERPKFALDGQSLAEHDVCATYDGKDYPTITVDSPDLPFVPTTAVPSAAPAGQDAVQAQRYDVIVSTPGGGALVCDSEAYRDCSGGGQLVWGNKRYGIPDATSMESLGYAGVAVAPVWSGVLRRIPAGLPDGVYLSKTDALKRL